MTDISTINVETESWGKMRSRQYMTKYTALADVPAAIQLHLITLVFS